MAIIAGLSVLAWYLALRTWWLSRCYLAWLERMKSGVSSGPSGADAGPRIQFVIRTQATHLDRAVRIVGACATMLPLLGLLGTVLGMLASFEVIQIHGTGQPGLLAGGIGQALITTQAGLLTAVPVLFFHHVVRNQVRLIRNETEMLLSTVPRDGEQEEQ